MMYLNVDYVINLIAFGQIKTFSRLQWLSVSLINICFIYYNQHLSSVLLYCYPITEVTAHWSDTKMLSYNIRNLIRVTRGIDRNLTQDLQSLPADLSKTELPSFSQSTTFMWRKIMQHGCVQSVCSWVTKQTAEKAGSNAVHAWSKAVCPLIYSAASKDHVN